MEEPPKIERIVSSQGISIADTATILKAYLSTIDQHHATTISFADDVEDQENDIPDEQNAIKTRKSRQDWEEEKFLKQLDQLSSRSSSRGMISDDVYERLKMVTESICAEAEGRGRSSTRRTSAMEQVVKSDDAIGETESNPNALGGGNDPAESNAIVKTEENQQQEDRQQQEQKQSKKDKKKEKKAKKAAKKAKKESKRKAKELESAGASEEAEGGNGGGKKIKIEN